MTTAKMTAPALTVRELGPHDGAVLDAVFAGLSTGSRFRRFHGAMPRMPAAVRTHLAAVDGRRHLALAAFVDAGPVGIARLITIGPGRADLAVEVVDAWQGHGIGARLVREVVALGRARGVTEVVAEVLAENVAMRRVLAGTFPDLVVTDVGPEITYVGRAPRRRRQLRLRRTWRAASASPLSIGGRRGMTTATGTVTRSAVRDITPALLGSLPFGVFFGVTITTHPVGPLLGLASAALFYGGSAHLSALTLIAAGAGPLAGLGAVVAVNARLAC